MARIESYGFGRITIDGKEYTSDVIIYPDRVDSSWWRKEGHKLQLVDIQAVLDANPDALVVGTGYYECMKVMPEVEAELQARSIELHVAPTQRACDIYNELKGQKRVVAALHLTC